MRSAENLVKGGDSSFHMQIIRASHWPEALNLSDTPKTHLFPSISRLVSRSFRFIVHSDKADSFYF